MITDGMTRASINISKYLFIIDEGIAGFVVVVEDDVDSVVVLAAFWILNPRTNDDVPIKKATTVRTFCVRPGIIATGEPCRVSGCCCCCWSCCFCAFAVLASGYTNDSDNSTIANVTKNNNNMLKAKEVYWSTVII